MSNKPNTAEHISKADTTPPLEDRISYVRELKEQVSSEVRVNIKEALQMERVGGNIFRLANPEQGLPREMVESIQKRGQDYMRFEVDNVGISVKCQEVDDEIVMSQSNLQQDYRFDRGGNYKG